jgi:hypothetical protein
MRFFKTFAAAIVASVLLLVPAIAQTNPGLTKGQVLTAGQWNALFASKQDYLGAPPCIVNGCTMVGKLVTAPSTTSSAGLNIPAGAAPTSPGNGDIWTTTAGVFVQINGATVGPLVGSGSPGVLPVANGGTGTSTAFTPGAVVFAGASGIYNQDPAISWDNTLKKLNLNLSGTPVAAAETATGFQMDGADGFATTIFMDSHGATAAIDFRQQGGTKASPTATATGATMGQVNFQGWDGTAYGKNARVRATAEPSGATWTLTDHGVGVGIFTTAPGTLLLTEKFHVFGNGGLATAGLTSQGAGTLNLAALYANNILIVDSSGNVTGANITASNNLSLGGANTFAFTGRTGMQSPSDGNLTLFNNAATGFTSLKLGGATASFPEIKRNATAVNFRLADDSADAPITASTGAFSGAVTHGVNGGSGGQIIMNGATSGSVTISTPAVAGSVALTLPTTGGTIAASGTSPIVVSATGAISCPTCNVTGANVSSVSNADGTMTISPTTGAVVASINLAHANTWSASQTFSAAMTYGGVTLSNSVTGTGPMVLGASPTITGHPTIEGVTSAGATGTVNFVFSVSPVLTGTPVLAAASATTLIVGSSTTLPSPAVGVFTANSTTLPNPAAGTALHVGGADGASSVVLVDAFAGNPTVVFRRADTSAAAKSAVQSGEVLLDFGATGYGATAYSASNRVQIVGKATQNWTDAAQGASLQINLAPNGSTTNAVALFVDNSGGISVGTTTSDGIGSLRANTSVNATTSYRLATKIAWSATAPTVNSGFCTSPSISNNNGTAAFTITIGSACAASTGVLTMPTASVGWSCHFNNVTTPASNTPYQTASTTTSVSVTNYARTTGVASNWTASEVVTAECTAY